MSTTTIDALAATGMIMAAYAGNPTPSLKPDELLTLIDRVHSKLNGFGGLQEEHRDEIMSAAARSSLAGSSVTVDAFDPAKMWPEQTPEVRAKFMALIEKHDILLGPDGKLQTRKPREKLVEPDTVYDPISGQGMTMLKRHLTTAYDLDEPELRAMFRLGDEFVITAPNYSKSKAKQAAKQGLGKHHKKKEEAEASRAAAATKQPKTKARKTSKRSVTTASSKAAPAVSTKAAGTATAKSGARTTSAKTAATKAAAPKAAKATARKTTAARKTTKSRTPVTA